MLSVKMDLLMKKLKDRANEKQEVMHIHDSHMTCEVCGNIGCLGNSYPKTQKDVNFVNNNMMNMSLRHGNAFKITLRNVLITGWRIGYSCRLSTMG